MSSEDKKVCDYYDVLLRQSDVDLLEGSNWLNDQVIAFYLEYLRQEKFSQVQGDLLFLDPSTAFMLTAVAPEEVPLLLGSLQATDKQMVIFPVNDNADPDKPGGSHWSIMCYVKPSSTALYSEGGAACFFHCDSFSGSNISAAKRLLPAARHLVGDTSAALTSLHVPQQQNCCDCGLFALAFADRLAEFCASSWSTPSTQQPATSTPEATSDSQALRRDHSCLQELLEKATSTATQQVVSTMRGSIQSLINDRSLNN